MRHFNKGLTILLLTVSMVAAAGDDYSNIEERIRAMAPTAESIAISETPIDGILQVQINGDIVYMSADGNYMLQGRIIDMETREDLTEASKSGLRQKLIQGIDPSRQITFSPEDPDYELMVFTDIDCGYCRKLHSQMDEYNKKGIAI